MTVNLTGDWMSVQGNRRAVVATLDFDSSYPTGGESLTAAQLGLGVLDNVQIESKGGYVFSYDYTNSKVLVYDQKDPAAAGGADIALPEVGNAVSLASLTGVRLRAVGR